MKLKNMIFLLLSIGFIQVLQLEAALTPGNIPSQAAYCVASAAPRAVNNSFSYESFAAQGVQLPPCDEAQARLWQNMLLDPELQGEQSGSNWTKYALPAAGLGAAGTTAVYNYWKLRKAREEAAERYQPEQIVPHQTPTQPNPVPEGVIIPSTDTIPTQTPPTFSPTTRWWKKHAHVITTAFAAAGFGGTKLAHQWNQTTTDVGAHELAVRNRPTTTANIETQQVVVSNQTITNAATQELVVRDRQTTERLVLQNRPTRINIETQTDPDGPTEAQQLLAWNPPTTIDIDTQTDLHRSTTNIESQTYPEVPPLNLYTVTSHDQNSDAVITSRTDIGDIDQTGRNTTMSTISSYYSPRRTIDDIMQQLIADGFHPYLVEENERCEIKIREDEWNRYIEYIFSRIDHQHHENTRLPAPTRVDCETQYSQSEVDLTPDQVLSHDDESIDIVSSTTESLSDRVSEQELPRVQELRNLSRNQGESPTEEVIISEYLESINTKRADEIRFLAGTIQRLRIHHDHLEDSGKFSLAMDGKHAYVNKKKFGEYIENLEKALIARRTALEFAKFQRLQSALQRLQSQFQRSQSAPVTKNYLSVRPVKR